MRKPAFIGLMTVLGTLLITGCFVENLSRGGSVIP